MPSAGYDDSAIPASFDGDSISAIERSTLHKVSSCDVIKALAALASPATCATDKISLQLFKLSLPAVAVRLLPSLIYQLLSSHLHGK